MSTFSSFNSRVISTYSSLYREARIALSLYYSAGIGRTGTFIALDVLSRYGQNRGKINVIEYVKAMRKDRMTMIQNVVSMISCITVSFVQFNLYFTKESYQPTSDLMFPILLLSIACLLKGCKIFIILDFYLRLRRPELVAVKYWLRDFLF